MKTLAAVFKNKEIMSRIFFTLMCLFIFRLGANIIVPGAQPTDRLTEAINTTNTIGLLNMIGGGALQTFSIFALGVSPYITAQIIIQLLSMDVLPALTELTKQGEHGRKKIDMATRYLTLMLGAVQAYAMITLMKQNDYVVLSGDDFWTYAYIIVVMLGGTMFAMWLGDQITEKGIGNGISMIIFSGIVVNIPKQIQTAFTKWILQNMGLTEAGNELFVGLAQFVLYIIMFLVIILFVVFIEMSKRKIPVQHSSKSGGQNTKMSSTSFLPIKLNSSGVLPVIFASSILTAPVIVASFFGETGGSTIEGVFNWTHIFDPNGRTFLGSAGFWMPFGAIIYVTLIILFSFFYAQIQINPEKMAENFQKNGSYIPGIRPGNETERYVRKVVNRVTCMGAIALAIIALIPVIISLTQLFGPESSALALGGTGLIIVVGVSMELKSQVEGLLAGKSFEEASSAGRGF